MTSARPERPHNHNLAQFLKIKPGQECELWAGRDRILTGCIDTVASTIAGQSHFLTIGGRNATADLVDNMATTMIYTHVLNRGGRGVRSPLDQI
jgi:prophage tail gpP-like protein